MIMEKILNVTLAVRVDTEREDAQQVVDDLSFDINLDTTFNNGDTKVLGYEVVDFEEVVL